MKLKAAAQTRLKKDVSYRLTLELKRRGVFDKQTEKLLNDFYINAAISTILNHTSVFLVSSGGFNISSIVSMSEFDDMISDTMLNVGTKKAYSKREFGGKTEKVKLMDLYGKLGAKRILTRKDAIYFVGKREGLFPNNTQLGKFINTNIGI